MLIDKKSISKNDCVLFGKILNISFLFNKSVKTYNDICAIFGTNENWLISKRLFSDINKGWADCPTSKQNDVTGIKFLTNKIKKKSVVDYLQKLHKNEPNSIWRNISSKIQLYSIPNIEECLTYVEYMRDYAMNFAVSNNVYPDEVYIRQYDNNRRMMLIMHLTTYYNKDWDRVTDVWVSINDFCYDSDKYKWVNIFKTIGEDVTDEDIDKFWNKLKMPSW